PRRGRADRLFLDERARGPAAVEDVRGCRRRKSELCALVRFDHSVAHRDREQRLAAYLAPRGHHHGEPAAQRGAAAIRPAAGARPHPAGALPEPAVGTASTQITIRPPTTPTWSRRRSCRRVTRNSSNARNGPARSPSTTPTTNG